MLKSYAAILKAEFDESAHPRDKTTGRFTDAVTDMDRFGPTIEHAMRNPPKWARFATVAQVTSLTNDPTFDAKRTGWTVRQWHKTQAAADKETKTFTGHHAKPRVGARETYQQIQTVEVKRGAKKPREVYIEEDPVTKSIFVRYAERGKHQHYLAAQFAKDGKTRQQVEEWVKGNTKLALVKKHGEDR